MEKLVLFLYRASPLVCHEGFGDELYLAGIVPGLIRRMEEENGTEALRSLYELCDVKNRHHRTPLVSSKRFDVLSPLSSRLYREDREGVRLACLTLNNLSIPEANKRLMIFDRSSDDVLAGLCHVVREGLPEACIAIICLVNLAQHEQNVVPIMHHAPKGHVEGMGRNAIRNLTTEQNPYSLLRTMEKNMVAVPVVPSEEVSLQSETLRWTCFLVKHLSVSKLNATLLAKTRIPARLVGYIKLSPRDPKKWTKDCIEVVSLQAVCNLARWAPAHKVLREAGAIDAMVPISRLGGLHGSRACEVASLLTGYKKGGRDEAFQ